MFIGELLCAIPLIWGFMTAKPKADKDPQASVFTRILSRIPLGTASTTTPNQYAPVLGEDDSSEDGDEEDDHARWQQVDNSLSGWRMGLMWFPAFFDSAYTPVVHKAEECPCEADISLWHDAHERRPDPHAR